MTAPSIWYHDLGRLMLKTGVYGAVFGLGLATERLTNVRHYQTATDAIKTIARPVIVNTLWFGFFPITVPFTILDTCNRVYNEDKYIEEDRDEPRH